MNLLIELGELEAYLEGSEDVTNDGGPNDAMRVNALLSIVLPRLDDLVAAATQTVQMHEGAPTVDALQRAVEEITGGRIFGYRDEQA